MNDILSQKTSEFVQAVVDEIVGDCISIAKDTSVRGIQLMWATPYEMRSEIVKRLEEYRAGVEEKLAEQPV